MAKRGGILGSSPTLPHPGGTSRKMSTSTGSGSRPGSSRVITPTSAPTSPSTLGRSTPNALK